MIKNPKKDDIVMSARSGHIAKVIEVSDKFGWFMVKYLRDGYTRRHDMNSQGENQSFYNLTPEERADLFLKLENAGLTDYWQE